jgi:hypothetical protein
LTKDHQETDPCINQEKSGAKYAVGFSIYLKEDGAEKISVSVARAGSMKKNAGKTTKNPSKKNEFFSKVISDWIRYKEIKARVREYCFRSAVVFNRFCAAQETDKAKPVVRQGRKATGLQ